VKAGAIPGIDPSTGVPHAHASILTVNARRMRAQLPLPARSADCAGSDQLR
jgi:hypothetical protein